jgi:hypothetical protein
MGEGDEATQTLVACIDLDNPGAQDKGQPLFEADGKQSPYLLRKMATLAELVDGEQRARLFTERMMALGLIRPVQLEVKAPEGGAQKIGGLYSIDEARLRTLGPEALAELNGKGYLHVMHAILL